MGLTFRKSIPLGLATRLTLSPHGLSASRRFGRVSLSSRGRGSLRLGRGLRWVFGGGR